MKGRDDDKPVPPLSLTSLSATRDKNSQNNTLGFDTFPTDSAESPKTVLNSVHSGKLQVPSLPDHF
jgi:hypothetical protein